MTKITREGETFDAIENYVVISCYKCGIPFGVPTHWQTTRRKDKGRFYCPNGHGQSYIVSTESKLRDKLRAKEEEAARERRRTEEARRQRDNSRKSHRKMRDRVKNGVCPCCNRTFQNLSRHMKTEHPELGDNQALRKLRESYGMSQSGLAEEVGVTSSHISCFECGRSVTLWARDQIEAWIHEQGQA